MSKKDEKGVKKEQVQWTNDMDIAFIQSMLDQQEKGFMIEGHFTTQAYANMVNSLSKQLNRDINKNHLKNRLITLKEKFAKCYDVFRGVSLSGFSYNNESKQFEAEEDVWKQLIEEKPETTKWKGVEMANYNELLQLFSKDRATGASAKTAKEQKAQMNNIKAIEIETITDVDNLVATNNVTLENNFDCSQVESPMPFSPEQNSIATKYKSKKRKLEVEDAASLKITSSIDNVANAIREGNFVLQESNSILERAYQREYTGDEIYKELEPIGLDPDVITSAVIFLAENPKKARVLFSSPFPLRMKMLTKMMGESS